MDSIEGPPKGTVDTYAADMLKDWNDRGSSGSETTDFGLVGVEEEMLAAGVINTED